MSSPIPIWRGAVDADGKLRLEADSLFRAYIKRLRNKPVQLVLKIASRPKSHSQLGYLFGVLYPVIADELGYCDYEIDAVHDACMRELRGLRPDPNPLKLRVSLAEMPHEEVSAYIEDLRHWAVTRYGIITPDAEQVERVKTKRTAA